MRDDAVPVKTSAGRDEIGRKSHHLNDVHLRQLLLLVDGRRTIAQLRAMAGELHAPEHALERLHALALIDFEASPEAVPASAGGQRLEPSQNLYTMLYLAMSDAVREHLGLRGYFLQIKIERCSNADELLQLLPTLTDALARVHGVGFAVEFRDRLHAMAQR